MHPHTVSSITTAAALMLLAAPAHAQDNPASPLKLWYDEPASAWNQALPVGNGRLGAMIFGGVERERIQLNEETLWSGGPYDPVVAGAHEALPRIRDYLFDGDFVRAHDLFGRTMMGVPYEMMKYQPFADLWLDFPGHEGATDYRRELDLRDGVARVSYVVDGTTYLREVFSSAVDQVVVVRITADRPGAVTFSANLHGVRNPAHSNYGTDYFLMDGIPPGDLRVTGKSSDYLGIEGRLRYEGRVRARVSGGTTEVDYRTLHVRDADEAVLVFAAATSFVDYRNVSASPAERVQAALSNVRDRSWDAMRTDHVREHRSWFDRVELTLGAPAAAGPSLPTDERIERFADNPDPGLAALYYQFGRYLLIASSRPGTQPANLQGIWNDNPNPSWDSKYTININLPMNYWPAETGNLQELVQPLERFTYEVAEAGAATAREHWNARGWVLHQNTDLWRATTPMDGPSWGAWPVGGAWIMTILYEHYRFSRDEAYLERIYPALRGQTQFLLDILVEHPDYGWLVTAPSNSPENFPAWPGNGRFFDEVSGLFLKARTMAAGPTMDMQIIREVFAEFVEAASILGMDGELAAEANAARSRLAPNQIGKHGQLQEWIEDYDEIEPEHRHLSHLWGLYPGSEITAASGDLTRAAAVSLDRRGTGGCGWSYGWKMGLRARLLDGEKALLQLRALLTESSLPNFFSLCSGVLQVDGNFGATASIAEMLLQSQNGMIRLLPALPSEWSQGSVNGLRARGGFTVSMRWTDGSLMEAGLEASVDGPCRVVAEGLTAVLSEGRTIPLTLTADGSFQFEAHAGFSYQLMFEG
ncbi:MAG: glycoside hydrolase family 95 protein [Gemmatimonadetes bacterium]|nr:glycoside hydrolase family 95 protein [Gemmatimonadota bacterium]